MLCFFATDAGTATSTYGSGSHTKQPRIWSTRSRNCHFGSPTFDEVVQVGPLSDQHVGAREVVASQMGTPNGQVTIGPPPPPTFGPLCNQWSKRLVAKVAGALGLEHVICKCYALNYYRICSTAFMMRCAESRAYFPSPVCGCRDRRTSLHLYPTTNLTTWIWGVLCKIPHVVVRSLSGQWTAALFRKWASADTSVAEELQVGYLTDVNNVISLVKRHDTMFGLCKSAAK